MSDSGKIIDKDPEELFFASEAGEYGARQYTRNNTPSRQLAKVAKLINHECTEREASRYMRQLPEVMAYADFDSKGQAILKGAEEERDRHFPGSGIRNGRLDHEGLRPDLGARRANSIMEGAMYKVALRKCVPIQNMKSQMEQMAFFTTSVFLKPVAPGVEALDIAQDLGMNILNAQAFRAMAKIGKEVVHNATTDVKAAALVELGKAQEMTLNQWGFSHMGYLSGVGVNSVGVGASGFTTSMINGVLYAQALGLSKGFDIDTCVMWPVPHYQVYSAILPGYNTTAQDILEAKRPFEYGGLKFFDTAVPAAGWGATTGPTFGWSNTGTAPNYNGSGGDIGALVFDSSRVGKLGIAEDMNYDEFSDPMKYLDVPIVNMRYDFAISQDQNFTTRNNANGCVPVYLHT